MKYVLLPFVLLVSCPTTIGQKQPIAFVDVSVIPMDSQRVLQHQTVMVRDDRIAAIGEKDSVRVPAGALKIDGKGRYLMPGLVDMHAHFLRPPVPGVKEDFVFPDYHEKNVLFGLLYVANGVTSMRNLWGQPETDKLSELFRSGELIGPTIYSSGPITDGDPPEISNARVVKTAEQARQAVRDDKAHGYVGIKIYDYLSLEAYKAIVDEAKKVGLPVFGHLPDAVPLEIAIQSHQASIEHVDGWLNDLQPNPATAEKMTTTELMQRADFDKMAHFSKEMHDAGVWVCPTIVVYQMEWAKGHSGDGMNYFSTEFLKPYLKHYELFHPATAEVEIEYGIRVVRALHQAGVGLLAGSDAFKPNVVPGFSLLAELSYLVKADLTPYEAIKAATIDPARFLKLEGEFGAVKVGLRADLLLLNANPLEDVHNVAKRSGVMLRGKWFPENVLQGNLQKYDPPGSH